MPGTPLYGLGIAFLTLPSAFVVVKGIINTLSDEQNTDIADEAVKTIYMSIGIAAASVYLAENSAAIVPFTDVDSSCYYHGSDGSIGCI